MADNSDSNAAQDSPRPYPGLKSLNKLVDAWKVCGPDIDGQVRFEWMEGGFFLIQHFYLPPTK
jgi:hypothetical protein